MSESADRPMPIRPRRLRRSALLRGLTRRVELGRRHIVVPVFVRDGVGESRPIASMPGVSQMSVDVAGEWLAARAAEGFAAYLAFGVTEAAAKTPTGSAALDADNAVCRLVRATRRAALPMLAITDLCFCEYTDHGHCGVLTPDGAVDNDATLRLLGAQAVSHARAGADIVAPSGMMDGAVGAIRRALDAAGFLDVAILSYAVKYASALYGPFREAAESAPAFGDRRGYQMDPSGGVDEAVREAMLDVEQGADMVMVKPALPYLDVLAAVRGGVRVPVAAYQVSGEYAMIEAAARQGWIDRDRVLLESLTAIRRAGADFIVSYHADALARLLPAEPTAAGAR